jgi:REP element-mobilizing transposase RayT
VKKNNVHNGSVNPRPQNINDRDNNLTNEFLRNNKETIENISKPVFSQPYVIKTYTSELLKNGYKSEAVQSSIDSETIDAQAEGDSDYEFLKFFNGITYKINYNILFCTKHNRNLFEDPAAKNYLQELITQRYDSSSSVDLESIDINGNNVLIQCKASPVYSSFDILSGIKEITSQKFREKFPQFYEKGYNSLWSRHFMIHTDEISQEERAAFVKYHKLLANTHKVIKEKPAGLVLEDINYDILFVTRRNREIITGEFKEALEHAILNTFFKDKWNHIKINNLQLGRNYVNINISVTGRDNPNKIIYDIKRDAASLLKKKYPEIIKTTSLWTQSYLISTENIPDEIKDNYIAFHKENFTHKLLKK